MYIHMYINSFFQPQGALPINFQQKKQRGERGGRPRYRPPKKQSDKTCNDVGSCLVTDPGTYEIIHNLA